MRFVKVLIPFLLVVSVFANIFMYLKWRKNRPIMTINGAAISQKEVDDYLYNANGPIVKAIIAKRVLIDQAAKKQNVVPTQAEVDEVFNNQKEANWQFARKMAVNPWNETDAKNTIRESLEMNRLRALGIKVTDDEIKADYAAQPSAYDTPNKAHCYLALVLDSAKLDDVKQLMDQNIDPNVIMRNNPSAVRFIGDNNKYTYMQRFGSTDYNDVFTMKPGEVKVVTPDDAMKQQGVQAVIVRLIDTVPGHKADIDDAKTKAKISLNVAAKRMKPEQEFLSDLWRDKVMKTENPEDERYIEQILLPDHARAAVSAGN